MFYPEERYIDEDSSDALFMASTGNINVSFSTKVPAPNTYSKTTIVPARYVPSHKEEMVQSNVAMDRCMICLSDIDLENALTLEECHHRFDAPCIQQWIRTQTRPPNAVYPGTCPICREAVTREQFPSMRRFEIEINLYDEQIGCVSWWIGCGTEDPVFVETAKRTNALVSLIAGFATWIWLSVLTPDDGATGTNNPWPENALISMGVATGSFLIGIPILARLLTCCCYDW